MFALGKENAAQAVVGFIVWTFRRLNVMELVDECRTDALHSVLHPALLDLFPDLVSIVAGGVTWRPNIFSLSQLTTELP